MCADIPSQKPKERLPQETSWPVNFSTLKSPPPWFANTATTIIILLAFFLLFLAAIAIVRLTIDLLGNDTQRASDAVKSLLPVIAAAVGLPLIIWRLAILNEQTRISEAKTQIDRETYYTSIFAKSVELLGFVRESKSVGADGNAITRSVPNIETRLGALYSLERLLTESIRDQRSIIETLCAYVRENSPLEIPEDKAEAEQFFRGDLPPRPTHRADVQAALTIIGRIPEVDKFRSKRNEWRFDLRNTNLVIYDFSNLNYDYARFDNSFLNGANMSGAHFSNCVFKNTFMRGAKMKAAIFHSANFDDCDMRGAEIEGTDFSGATIVDTNLRNAKVVSLNIKGANLEEAFPGFDFTLKYFKEHGANSVNSQDLWSINELFQKATFDDFTSVSDAVREAIVIMRNAARRTAAS